MGGQDKPQQQSKRVLIEYPSDGSQYIININKLEYYQKNAEELKQSLLKKGAPEEIANHALFKVVKYLD